MESIWNPVTCHLLAKWITCLTAALIFSISSNKQPTLVQYCLEFCSKNISHSFICFSFVLLCFYKKSSNDKTHNLINICFITPTRLSHFAPLPPGSPACILLYFSTTSHAFGIWDFENVSVEWASCVPTKLLWLKRWNHKYVAICLFLCVMCAVGLLSACCDHQKSTSKSIHRPWRWGVRNILGGAQ